MTGSVCFSFLPGGRTPHTLLCQRVVPPTGDCSSWTPPVWVFPTSYSSSPNCSTVGLLCRHKSSYKNAYATFLKTSAKKNKIRKMTEISNKFFRSNFHCGYSFFTWPNLRDINVFHAFLLHKFLKMNREYLHLGSRTKRKRKLSKFLCKTSSEVENYFLKLQFRRAMKHIWMFCCTGAKGSNKYKSNQSP